MRCVVVQQIDTIALSQIVGHYHVVVFTLNELGVMLEERVSMIVPGDFFEIGLIVPNLEEAIERFHRVFRYTFTLILDGVLPTRDQAGETVPPMRMAVSRETPQLELLEAAPGTHLVPPKGTGLHHLGYYVDDLEGESKRLTAMGISFARGGFADGSFPGDPPEAGLAEDEAHVGVALEQPGKDHPAQRLIELHREDGSRQTSPASWPIVRSPSIPRRKQKLKPPRTGTRSGVRLLLPRSRWKLIRWSVVRWALQNAGLFGRMAPAVSCSHVSLLLSSTAFADLT